MVDIRRFLQDLDWKLAPDHSAAIDGSTITVRLPGNRSQRVRVEVSSERYLFTSTVLGSTRASRFSTLNLAHLVFNANQHTDVVAFSIDGRGRFVGSVEQPVATLDREELRTYLLLLARECDRLEFLLTGRDVS